MLDLMRLKQILNPVGQSPYNPSGPVMSQPDMDMGNNDLLMQQLLNPQDAEFEQLKQLLAQIPQRQNYEPSKMRRIAAFGAGLGNISAGATSGGARLGYHGDVSEGLKNQQAVLNQPYNQAVGDWLQKSEPTYKAAQLENSRNVNQRVAASNIRTAQLRDKSIERQIDRDRELANQADVKAQQNQQKIDISKQRADAYTYDRLHPTHVYKADSKGNVYGIDPKTNETEYLTDSEGNNIKSENLPDELKLKQQHANTISEIGARGAQTRENQNARDESDFQLFNTKDENGKDITVRVNRKTGDVSKVDVNTLSRPAASRNAGNETPAAKKVRLYNRATEALNSHPDWKDYIHLSPGNNFTLSAPRSGNDRILKDINRFIYEGASGKKVKMMHPDGKTAGLVPEEQVQEAIKQGYKEIK